MIYLRMPYCEICKKSMFHRQMASPVSEVDRFVSGLRNRTLHGVVDKLNIGFYSRISYRNLSSGVYFEE